MIDLELIENPRTATVDLKLCKTITRNGESREIFLLVRQDEIENLQEKLVNILSTGGAWEKAKMDLLADRDAQRFAEEKKRGDVGRRDVERRREQLRVERLQQVGQTRR